MLLAPCGSRRKFPEVDMVVPLFKNGLVKIDYHHTYASREWHVIRWLQAGGTTSGPFSDAELNSIATQVQSAWSPIVAFTSTANVFDGTKVTDFTNDTGAEHSITAGGTGTESSAGLPIQVAMEVSLKIGRHYRGGHPKLYLSGMTDGQLDSVDQWLGSFVSALKSAMTTFLNALYSVTITRGSVVVTFAPVNVSKFTGHAERTTLVTDNILDAEPQVVTASQRRRRERA